MNKLYCVKSKTGHILIQDATIEYLETKLEFSLNDLIETSIMKVGDELSRKLKIKTKSELYETLTKRDKTAFHLTVERTL